MTTEQKEVIDDWMASAEEVDAPVGDYPVRVGQSLGDTVDGQPIGAKVTQIEKGRHFIGYNTRTGDASIYNRVHLQFLNPDNPRAWKWEDGTLMVSTTCPPGLPVLKEKFMCLLHPDHADRERYDAMGLQGRYCFGADRGGNAGIPSPYDVERHMMRRHPGEWALIQRAENQKRESDRDSANAALIALALERGAALPKVNIPSVQIPSEMVASDGTTTTTSADGTEWVSISTTSDVSPTPKRTMDIAICEVCPAKFRAMGEKRVANKLKKHVKEEHPDG